MYRKYIFLGGVGVSVWGNKDDMTCEYGCTRLPSPSVFGKDDDDCFSRISNIDKDEKYKKDIGEPITKKEYEDHIRFAILIASSRIEGKPMPTKININKPNGFDCYSYFDV
jgi:hypothetical protein